MTDYQAKFNRINHRAAVMAAFIEGAYAVIATICAFAAVCAIAAKVMA